MKYIKNIVLTFMLVVGLSGAAFAANPLVTSVNVLHVALLDVADDSGLATDVHSATTFGSFTNVKIGTLTVDNNNMDGFDLLIQPDTTSQIIARSNQAGFIRNGVLASVATTKESALVKVSLADGGDDILATQGTAYSNNPKENGLIPDNTTAGNFVFSSPTGATQGADIEVWLGVSDGEIKNVLVDDATSGSIFTVTMNVTLTEN